MGFRRIAGGVQVDGGGERVIWVVVGDVLVDALVWSGAV